jgi:hypothetical protein
MQHVPIQRVPIQRVPIQCGASGIWPARACSSVSSLASGHQAAAVKAYSLK